MFILCGKLKFHQKFSFFLWLLAHRKMSQLDSLAPAPRSTVLELPAPSTASVATLVRAFATRGLGDPADLMALSGAHTIGRSECSSFSD
jgi:peroxidase